MTQRFLMFAFSKADRREGRIGTTAAGVQGETVLLLVLTRLSGRS